jgi:hypothetical protein
MNRKQTTLSICGPVKDGQFTVWVVRGPRGGQVAEFLTRKAARYYVKKHKHPKKPR